MLHFYSGSVFYYTIIACISITHSHCHLQNKLVFFAYETIMYQECQERQVRWDRELIPGKSSPNENGRILKELTWLFFVCFSVTQSCPTLCDPMNHSTPGIPVHHQLPEFTQCFLLNNGSYKFAYLPT